MHPREIVRQHIQRKCKLFFDDADIVSGHIENERAVTNDYRGRVLYELLQNAVDRAESTIWVFLDSANRSLTVANDGKPFSEIVRPGEPRSDLAALCSLHTSNKTAGESIGNKGIGFKSVWEFCHSVQIRTRYDNDDKSWGIRLRWPFNFAALQRWSDQATVADILNALSNSNIEEKHQGKAPSFYFPEYIDTPVWYEEQAVTAIEMEDILEEDMALLRDGPLKELLDAPLAFVSDIRRDGAFLNLHIKQDDAHDVIKPLYTSENEWIRVNIDTSSHADELVQLKDKLGFELKRNPRLALAFPLTPVDEKSPNGLIHSYLPTEVSTGSPMHIQGDFYLSESRKNIDFKNNQYNQCLLDIAIETLFKSIEENKSGIAALPYVFSLLTGSGVLSNLLNKRLSGNGELLSSILSQILKSRSEHTISLFNNVYKIIGIFTPPKTEHYHSDHKALTLKPYFSSFSRKDLKIVPVEFDKQNDAGHDPEVSKSISLPMPEKEGGESRLFCRRGAEVAKGLNEVNVPGVVVTRWRFPVANNISEHLSKFSVWTDYEPISVLRAIVRAQKGADSDEDKGALLKAATKVAAPIEIIDQTQWRFLSDSVYPSQLLLIPTLGSDSWTEARLCYFPDRNPLLLKCIDHDRVRRIDEKRCEQILGIDFRNVLRYWGVWDVIPLISLGGLKGWDMPLTQLPTDYEGLRLFADSWQVWEKSKQSNLNKVLDTIRTGKWLRVSSGSMQYESPESVFLGVIGGNVKGFFILNQDELNEKERRFLSELFVFTVESTIDIEKLVYSAVRIADGCHKGLAIKGTLLSAYRRLVKRLNQIIYNNDKDIDLKVLTNLPLFYETGELGQRGVALATESVWYASGNYRTVKSKVGTDDILWWLASGDVGTLAAKINKVNTLTSETKLIIDENGYIDKDLFEFLEKEYLPLFMALACYGDIPGISDIDEAHIQERWEGFQLFRVSGAELHEKIGAEGESVSDKVSNISDTLLLWEPLRSDQKKKLVLYAFKGNHDNDVRFKHALCAWFAEEVFRRRELTRHFVHLITGVAVLSEYGVTEAALDDAKQVINEWMPDEVHAELINELSQLIHSKIDARNWLDTVVYNGFRYDQLFNTLSSKLRPYFRVLNPEERNLDLLVNFVDLHRRKFVALPKFSDYNDGRWREVLKKDKRKYEFGFDPKIWILDRLGLTGSEFDLLEEKLDADIQDLEKEEKSDILSKVTSLPPTAKISDINDKSTEFAEPSIVDAKTNEEYATEQYNNAKSGKNIERRLAIISAKRIASLSLDKQQMCYGLVCGEYNRLASISNKSNVLMAAKNVNEVGIPQSESQWLNILHVADKWNGLGYDYIDFDDNSDELLLVEAKSSRQNKSVMFFSEPERRSIIKYSSNDFKSEYPRFRWCLFLVTKDNFIDVTDTITPIVLAHEQKHKFIKSNLGADGWILKGLVFS